MVDFYPILKAAALAPGGAAEVGNKAWNLMRMAQDGLPTPPAFVLPTTWSANGRPLDETRVRSALAAGIAVLQDATGLSFGGARNPLLVSVRSGAAVSMPGMMETVLDIGLNRQTVAGLVRMIGNPRLAWDSFRRLVQAYAVVVSKLPTAPFDALVAQALARDEVAFEQELDHRSLRTLTEAMLDQFRDLSGAPFPDDPHEQLAQATMAVFGSWRAPKAKSYRTLNDLSDDGGTAVTVQTMVYGNAGGASGAGVGFTRNPATGAREFYYDFRFNAQGEDVVAGRQALHDSERLQRTLPVVWARLIEIRAELERVFGDAQDFEFTVQSGVLYLLQTRRAKRTDWAAVAMAVDMVEEGVMTRGEALKALAPIDVAKLVRTHFSEPVPPPLAVASGASLGVVSGAIALDGEAVKRLAGASGSVILVRDDSATADIEAMAQATGILTGKGGRTSHAAVVARQLGKVCVVGCPNLTIDLVQRQCRIGTALLKEGDLLSLDGGTGQVFPGRLPVVTERPDSVLATIAGWRLAETAP